MHGVPVEHLNSASKVIGPPATQVESLHWEWLWAPRALSYSIEVTHVNEKSASDSAPPNASSVLLSLVTPCAINFGDSEIPSRRALHNRTPTGMNSLPLSPQWQASYAVLQWGT